MRQSVSIPDALNNMGVEWYPVRGKPCLAGMFVDAFCDGFPVSFTRRRYSNATFCWAEAYINGQWESLGDPWQKVTPNAKELAAEIRKRLEVQV